MLLSTSPSAALQQDYTIHRPVPTLYTLYTTALSFRWRYYLHNYKSMRIVCKVFVVVKFQNPELSLESYSLFTYGMEWSPIGSPVTSYSILPEIPSAT